MYLNQNDNLHIDVSGIKCGFMGYVEEIVIMNFFTSRNGSHQILPPKLNWIYKSLWCLQTRNHAKFVNAKNSIWHLYPLHIDIHWSVVLNVAMQNHHRHRDNPCNILVDIFFITHAYIIVLHTNPSIVLYYRE